MGNKVKLRQNIGVLSNPNKAIADVDIEYKRHKLQFCMQVAALNTFRVKTPQQMEERLQQLFDLCVQSGDIPTYENLAVACGIPIRTFYEMQTGNNEIHAEFLPIVKKAKDIIAQMESSMAMDGKMPSVVWIFRAKNYAGMRDVQQVEVAPTSSGDVPKNSNDLVAALPEIPDNAQIEEKTPIVMEKLKEEVDK